MWGLSFRDGLKDALAGKAQDKIKGKEGGKGRKPRN
jgi:hypothetical protein